MSFKETSTITQSKKTYLHFVLLNPNRAVSVTRDTREEDGVKHECYPLILPHLNQNVIKKIHPYAALAQLILFWVG